MDNLSRDKLIADAMKTGMSKADASILVDISAHAFHESIEAALRILDTLSPELRGAGLASVAGSWIGCLKEHFPDHWKALQANPDVVDQPTVIVLPPREQAEG